MTSAGSSHDRTTTPVDEHQRGLAVYAADELVAVAGGRPRDGRVVEGARRDAPSEVESRQVCRVGAACVEAVRLVSGELAAWATAAGSHPP